MKKVVRFVVFGPVYLVALVAFALVLPFVALLDWAFDTGDRALPLYWEMVREVWGTLTE